MGSQWHNMPAITFTKGTSGSAPYKH